MVLSYVAIGAAFAPIIHSDRLLLTLLAYFLGLGFSAHALNELHARHWGEALGKSELRVLFALPLIGALSIGGYGMRLLYGASGPFSALVLFSFMVVETFFVFAYNMDILNGRFHSDYAFAFSWAALPVMISYYVNTLAITPAIVFVALACAATAGIEINLSRWCKDLRRRSSLRELRFDDSSALIITTDQLIAKPEKALKLIVVAVDLIALSLIISRLFPWP